MPAELVLKELQAKLFHPRQMGIRKNFAFELSVSTWFPWEMGVGRTFAFETFEKLEESSMKVIKLASTELSLIW